jgi:predicted GIY-YIG superfamily endonuclease
MTRRGKGKTKGWVVYVLRCGDGSLYTGITKNLERRVAVHNAGRGGAYTRSHRPVRVAHWEEGFTHSQALRRELWLKALSRVKKEELIRRPVRKATLFRGPHRPKKGDHARKSVFP